ncbi:2-amino-4-hydroxy-6-hydroxymethyldihydropteridine diphosphokinase [Luteimicrobium sp. NPDC057192]|uniref:2-amino-4-hydroxy-6- hydroxymethyldihydropteridine diphosphokinase n=1 Tax=Luteimicrobium sp. NPDC057192 TaxID=3346042 RepID=UPI00362A3DEA
MTLPGTGPVHDDDGEVLDQIRLVGLRATGHHGVFEHERVNGQEFVADVVVHLDTRPAAAGDALARTVHYGELAERVTAVLSSSPADLIETVAERIAAVVLDEPAAVAVDVALHKPEAPITVPFDDVVVAVRRSRTRPAVVPVPVDLLTLGSPEPAPAPVVEPEPVAVVAPAELPTVAPVVAAAVIPPVTLPDTFDEPVDTASAEAEPVTDDEQDAEDDASLVAALRDHDRMDEIPASPVDVVLSLGSNQGDPQQTLRDAISALDAIGGIEVLDVSPLARTAPVGGVDQDDFLNAVVVARTSMSARELLHACQDVEHSFGRVREQRWGPRTLDVDIIVYGTLTDVSEDLELPHPRAHERAFVLEPWSQVQPEAVLPGLGGGPVAQLAATAPDRAGIRWLALDWLGDHEPEPAPAQPEAHAAAHLAPVPPVTEPPAPVAPAPVAAATPEPGPVEPAVAPVAPAPVAPAPVAPPAIPPGAAEPTAVPSGAVSASPVIPVAAPAIPVEPQAPAAQTLPEPSSAPTQSSPARPAAEQQPVEQLPAPPVQEPVAPAAGAPDAFDSLLAPAETAPTQPAPVQPAQLPPVQLPPVQPGLVAAPDGPPAPAEPASPQPAQHEPHHPEPTPHEDHRGDGPTDAATSTAFGDPFSVASPAEGGTVGFPPPRDDVRVEAPRFAAGAPVVGQVVAPTAVLAERISDPRPVAPSAFQPSSAEPVGQAPFSSAAPTAMIVPAPAAAPVAPPAQAPTQPTAPPEPAGGLLTGVPLSFPPVSGGTQVVAPTQVVASPASQTFGGPEPVQTAPQAVPHRTSGFATHGGPTAGPDLAAPVPDFTAPAPSFPEPGVPAASDAFVAPADAARPVAPLFPPTTEEPPTR